jgi:excisionase family DNA binding protein
VVAVESNTMDSSLTIGEVAARLGVSTPTVRRAARAAGIQPLRTEGGHRRFSDDDVDMLVAQLGVTPVIDDLSRTAVRVLAALARHPVGLRSVRAVARAAGVSPTAAGRALDRLIARRLAVAERGTVAEGAARVVTVYRLRIGPEWFTIADRVATAVLQHRTRDERPQRVPRRFWHLFWNADPAALTIAGDADYIAARMIRSPDLAARSWAFVHLPRASIVRLLDARGVDERDRAMIANHLAAA